MGGQCLRFVRDVLRLGIDDAPVNPLEPYVLAILNGALGFIGCFRSMALGILFCEALITTAIVRGA
jgi:hypothetical protein